MPWAWRDDLLTGVMSFPDGHAPGRGDKHSSTQNLDRLRRWYRALRARDIFTVLAARPRPSGAGDPPLTRSRSY